MSGENNTNALKPCPFCGETDIEIQQIGTARRSCIVSCSYCGCTLESNEIGAGHFWNQRYVHSQPDSKIYPKISDETFRRLAEAEEKCDISAGGGDIDDFIFHLKHDEKE